MIHNISMALKMTKLVSKALPLHSKKLPLNGPIWPSLYSRAEAEPHASAFKKPTVWYTSPFAAGRVRTRPFGFAIP